MAKQIAIAVVVALCICLATFTPQPAHAQAVYGSIIGTVTDPQGAAVANAKVTVTNQRKGTSDETTTNDSGNYSVTHLVPDTYTVRAEAQGFKRSEQKDVLVQADAASNVPLQFQVGGTSETVEVTGEAPQLKTDRADVATTFAGDFVKDMPILNRNFTTLQLMAPGSQKMAGWSHAATENPQQSQQIFTQGQHFSGTAFELDGTDNQDPILGIIVVNPNLDAVTEAKVALQNYDAEFGKAVGSVVTAQTRSGSNEIHGSGFFFRRSDAQQARDPFAQGPNQADPITHRLLPAARWAQFGGSVGGAIIKNKLFYFGDYQGTKQTNGVSGVFTLPTALVRSTCTPGNATGFCDLSEYANPANGISGGGKIFDPFTNNANVFPDNTTSRTPFCGSGGSHQVQDPVTHVWRMDCNDPAQQNWLPLTQALASANGYCNPLNPTQCAFASPAAMKILAALPAPASTTVLNNFTGSGSGPFSQKSFDVRIDYAATSTVSVFGRFSLDYFKLSGKGLLGQMQGPGDGSLGLAGSSITHNYSLSSGVTKTFSSTLLMDFRLGWFKYNPQTQKPDGGQPMTAFGIPGANTSDPKTNGLGFFALGAAPISGQGCTANNSNNGCVISSFGDGLGVGRCNCPLTESEQQVQFVNNWTKIRGNHQIKFGADIRYALNLRVPSDNNRTGEFNFSPEATAQAGVAGLDLATFLLGDVTQFQRYINNPIAGTPAERQKRWFFYGQDTWRASSKLTINYGLRWEIYFPETVDRKGGGGFANIVDLGGTGAIRVAGYGGIGTNGNVDNYFHAFAPRFGIAYQATAKTVVRMGYGRSYDIGVFGSNFGHTVTQNLPVLLKQNIKATNVDGSLTDDRDPIPGFTLDIGPTGPIPISPNFPAIPSNGIIPFSTLGGAIGGVHIRPIRQTLPAVDAWNATVQHQLTNTINLEVAYVGSKGTHGFAGNGPNYDINPNSIANFGAINPITGKVFTQNERRPLCGPEVTNPVPPQQLGDCSKIGFDLGNYYGNDAASTYNAFEVKVDKRLSQGLQLITHYTFSHANNYDSNYYAIDHRIAWGPVDFSRNHVFVFSPIYQLPFGKGKKYMGDASRAADYVVGGWELSNTTNWSSGLPWTPSFNECGPEQDVGVCRPNKGSGSFHTGVSGDISPANHNLTFYTPVPNIVTTPGAFTDPGFGNLGNIRRNSFRGPSGFYSDLSIVKKFPIHERLNAQFRMDAFNIFNHPVYAFSGNNGAQTCIDCSGGNNGKITGLEYGAGMRQLQFAVRFDF